jgi:hypothetical protein
MPDSTDALFVWLCYVQKNVFASASKYFQAQKNSSLMKYVLETCI